MYWRRENAHNKMRVRAVFVLCTAGAFLGYVDKVKSEWITKGDKTTEVL